jgi:hypothetical protein
MSFQPPNEPTRQAEPSSPAVVPGEAVVVPPGSETPPEVTGTSPSTAGEPAGTERVKQATSEAKEQTKQVASEAATQAKQVTADAKDQARQLFDRTQSELRGQAEEGTRRASQGLRTVGQQLQALREGRTDEAGPVAQYAEQAQQKLSQFADRLEGGGAQGVLDDISSFARRKPGVFLLACAAGGFFAGRLVRSQRSSGGEESSARLGSVYSPTYAYGDVAASPPLPSPDPALGAADLALQPPDPSLTRSTDPAL